MNLLTLAQASEKLAEMGVVLSNHTLRVYAEGRYTPRLPATMFGKTWAITLADLTAWAAEYKALPARGRRRK